MSKPKYMPGDIGLCFSPGFLSRAIRFVNTYLPLWRGDRIKYSHAFIIVHSKLCVEALARVDITPIKERLEESSSYLILRPKIDARKRGLAADRALGLVGTEYSYARLFMFFLDDLFSTRFFGKLMRDPKQVVCSELVAECYKGVFKFGQDDNLNPLVVAPEDILLSYQNHPKLYKVIDRK